MSFFPEGIDPRDEVVGAIDLVNVNTPDGDFGFMLGVDGVFDDVNGKRWWGSSLISSGGFEVSINGTAPSASLNMSFFQDASQGNLIAELRDLGSAYVEGRDLTFYVQPFGDRAEFYAPVYPPMQWLRRRMTTVEVSKQGDLKRSIALYFEGPFSGRNAASGMTYNTADHGRLIGSVNRSLRNMPSDTAQAEKLYG